MGHAVRTHRRFSPSQIARIAACPGSLRYLERLDYKRVDSPYAREGTKAHEILEVALRTKCRSARDAHNLHSDIFFEQLDDGKNGFYRSVQSALDYVYAILDEHTDAQMWIEAFVAPPLVPRPDINDDEAGGFCDVAIWVPSQRLLFVIDYKHGAGVAVDVKDNKQAMQYACGFVLGGTKINATDIDEVTLVIVQPRAHHPDGPEREHTVSVSELTEHMLKVNHWVDTALQPDAPLIANDAEQCRFCDGKTTCPAREAAAASVAGSTFAQVGHITQPSLPAVRTLDIQRLVHIKKNEGFLKKFLEDVDAHLTELARAGHRVPGMKLVRPVARRKYFGTDDEIAKRMATMIGCEPEDCFDRKLISVTEAETRVKDAYKARVSRPKKKAAAEEAAHAFAFLTTKTSSNNLTLVPDDDPRQEVTGVEAFTSVAGLITPPNPKG